MTNCWRFLGALPEYLYSYDEQGIFVNLYSSSKISQTLTDDRIIDLTVETEYPFDGKVKVLFNGGKSAQFNLRLRIPGWCKTATAAWTEQPRKTVENGTYLEIDRKWSSAANRPQRCLLKKTNLPLGASLQGSAHG